MQLCARIFVDRMWFTFKSFDYSAKQATVLMLEKLPMQVH
jgi:hypothetical protein